VQKPSGDAAAALRPVTAFPSRTPCGEAAGTQPSHTYVPQGLTSPAKNEAKKEIKGAPKN
jgi:hypothetical protein